LRRQQRQDGDENDAAPGEDAKRGREEVSAHRLWLSTVTELGRAGIWGRDRPRWRAIVLNNLRTDTRECSPFTRRGSWAGRLRQGRLRGLPSCRAC
jgi:hypothetical protein